MLGLIADDLTGACDSSTQFKKYGYSVIVTSKLNHKLKSDLLAVNLNCRELDAKKTYEKTKEVCSKLKAEEIKLKYVKIDSTLRGNFGQMIKAAMDTYGFNIAFIAPAYPYQRRITLGDYHLVNGNLLKDTEFGKEIEKEKVSEILEIQVGEKVKSIDLKSLEDERLEDKIRNFLKEGFRFFTFDSIKFSHLEKIAKLGLDLDALICGSAGLAEALAKEMAKIKRNLCVINGSKNRISRIQIGKLSEINFKIIEISVPEILDENFIDEEIRRVEQSIKKGQDLALQLKERLGSLEAVKEIIKRLLKLIIKNGFNSYIVIGGDTLNLMCENLNCSRFKILAELEPGLPLLKFLDGKLKGVKLVSKAGGFGDENSLIRIANYLKQL